MVNLRLLFASLFVLFSFGLSAQVSSVNYQMKYDTTTCLYDCYIIINSGSASTIQQRIQFNSQYTIITPFGTTIDVDTTYMPLIGNSGYAGTNPQVWDIRTSHDYPIASPTMTLHSITPDLNPIAHYNNIAQGDTIKIFSLSISPTVNCASDIRIFENGTDPNSSDPDMNGLDFSNGFTMGSTAQLYNANSTQLYPPKPLIVDVVYGCTDGIEIDLTASTSSCQAPLTYSWTGPNSYVSASEDVDITPATPLDNGIYEVVITDAFGCQDSVMINATSKPDAGADMIMCAGTTDTLFGTSPTTGTWSKIGAGSTLVNIGGGMALVTFNNAASGTYQFKYEIPGCSDTMSILVNPKPTVSIDGASFICTNDMTTLLPSTGGTWVSNKPSVATVTNAGVVTAVSSGTATFTYTATATGCSSTTPPVTVNPEPTVTNTGSDTICIGNTTNLTPSTGGTWSSSDVTVATITSSGVVTGISAGTAKFVFNETSTGCNSDSIAVTVTPRPVVSIVGSDSICVFSTTQLSPSTGGTWVSSDNLIATVSNGGVVTGLQPGKVVFTYTASASQCVSLPTDTVTVIDKPTVAISGDNRICVNANTTLSPSTGGTWVSNQPSVATVTNAGVVTSLSQGTVTFTYTDNVTGCFATTGALIVDPKPTVSVGQSNICIGAVTQLSPTSNGTWTNHSASIASLTGGYNVTGLTTGIAKFTFLEQGTDCESDTIFVTVEPGPTVSITGDDEICVGFTTQLSPTTGGTWSSSDNNIASVSNSGLVTGKAAGVVTFVFTSTTTFCSSEPTDPITVIARPIINLTDASICVDETTTITPTSGGTWTSNHPTIATVTNAGLITGIAPGTTTFIFTNTTTGCVSAPSTPITVNAIPDVEFSGPATICVGSTTNVSPVAGGTWVSNNTSVAVVTNTGVVTAVGPGTAELTYTETNTSCASQALTITVTETPVVAITGDTLLCIGGTSSVSPTTGGAWTSSNTSVATVTNAGVVTAVGQGSVTFTFISTAGCPSDPTKSINVNGAPTINITGNDEICIGDTSYLSPASEGIWTASDATVVDILPNGVVVGLKAGTVTFSYVDTITGCPSDDDSAPLTVNPKPNVIVNGPDNICVGSTTNISPTTGGTWQSVYDSVAVVNNVGIITGISPGITTFIFTNSVTGCSSDESAPVTVTPGPTINVTGDDEICEGETTTLSPTFGGTWESSDETVATVTNTGVVTGVGAGSATFVFTENVSGCKSEDSDPIIVHGKPTVSVDGSTVICKGGTTNLLPNTGGTWVSNSPLIASVTNAGLVTGIAEGTATFTFTLTATGCSSEDTEPIQVSPAPDAQITGDTDICIGATTTLSPSVGGTWTSSNPSVATVTNAGIVTAIAPGKVTFNFTETATGCSSESSTGELVISNCTNPDFNSTFVNVPVDGDASTNDMVSLSTTYGPSPVLTSSPSGSVATIAIASDGTYTFEANMVGVYIYNVPVCFPPFASGCPVSLLTITVVDHLQPDNRPVANVDIATTNINTDVTLVSLENDRCVVVTGCELDPGSVIITVNPKKGSGAVDLLTGDITYSPSLNFVGKDTLTYRVCVDGEPGNCATAKQIITINDLSSDNTTAAADDYAVTPESNPVSGNVKNNDSDAEGDNQSVTPQNVTVAAGTLVLAANGNYTFTPAEEFFGPVDFVYNTCDDNATVACANATLHILVVPDLSVKVRVYLEGALMANGNAKGTTHTRPLMRDNLRVSPFTGNNYIPTQDPYQIDIIDEGYGAQNYNTNLSSLYTHSGPGDSTLYLTISDPTTVFNVTGEDAIVDWVFIELRSKADSTVIEATRSGLVQRDGDVVDLNGKRGLRFSGMKMDDYYVVVKHRNHLGSMTKYAQTPKQLTTLVDFTVTTTELYDKGFIDYGLGVTYDFTGLSMKNNAKLTYRALWAGDFDGNNKIKASNPGDDLNVVFFDVFSHPDNTSLKANFDFAYGFRAADFDLNSKVKFDNPNDDKNMLFGQLLFYPLNTQFLSNFDFFLEQLPN